MKKIFIFIILMVCLSFVFPAKSIAQGDVAVPGSIITSVTEYDFEDDIVEIVTDGWAVELICYTREAKISSIRLKKNFIQEILKSVEDL